jgi:hypothetical protein
VELAEYAVANRIDKEPAFDWWVRDTLKRKKRLIKLSQSRHARTGFKFGIKLPRSIKQALEFDKENGNTFWYDAIQKELKNVRVAFEPRGRGTKPPPGYQEIRIHWVFDIKMDFTRKARLVAGGHTVQSSPADTYASVVSRDSVRMIFLISALNDLNICMADVGNAYLNETPKENVCCMLGDELGPEESGQLAILIHALYGLPGSGAAWRSHFANTLRDMGFISCLSDPDVWRCPATKQDESQYYEYLLVYIDDILAFSVDPREIITKLQEEPHNYRLKDIGPPKRYLGATIGKYDIDGEDCWYFSADDYATKAIATIEEKWGPLEKLFGKKKFETPASADYHPKSDESKPLFGDDVTLYQSYIGILRWAVELHHIDLRYSAATMY